MPTRWPLVRVEHLAEKVAMGPFGSSIKVETFVSDGIPIISGQHLHGVRVKDGDNNFITRQHADKLSNANVRRGDVIFTHAGTIGQVAFIPENSTYERYVISQRQFYLRCDPAKADPAFVTYYFKSAEGQHKLLANTSSSGVPSIARPSSYLKSIEIPLPPLAEQHAIAEVLGALDDKIELNERMNATLDEMARALFKSWFVDFDPVRAKAEGRQPAHMDAATAALFPDSFEDSSLGPIPAGWKVGTVGSFSTVTSGKRPSGRSSQWSIESSIPLYGGAGPMGYVSSALYSSPILVTGRVGTLGIVHRITTAVWPSDNTLVLLPRSPIALAFLFNAVRSMDLVNLNRGSTQPLLTQTDLREGAVIQPPGALLELYSAVADSLYALQDRNVTESSTLGALRDLLLPKLITGELRLRNAARDVEAAV